MGQMARSCTIALLLLSALAISIGQKQDNGQTKQDNGQPFDVAQAIKGIGELLKVFPNSTLSKDAANILKALPGNFSKLPTNEMLSSVLSAASTSGLNMGAVTKFLNTNGIQLPFDLQNVGTSAFSTDLAIQGLTAVIVSSLTQYGISTQCLQDLGRVFNGIGSNEMWAMTMLDAMGKPESRIWQGHLRWLGSFDQCLDVEARQYRSATDFTKLFGGQYCTVAVKPPVTLLPPPLLPFADALKITVGICVPDTCSKSDVSGIFKTVATVVSRFRNATSDTKDAGKGIEVSCQIQNQSLSPESIAALALLGILGALMVAGTMFDFIDRLRPSRPLAFSRPSAPTAHALTGQTNRAYVISEAVAGNSSATEMKDLPSYADAVSEKPPLPSTAAESYKEEMQNGGTAVPVADTMPVVNTIPARSKNILEKCLLSFSVYTNAKKIMNANQAAGSLGSVNGIRFLSMAWVILGHTLFFGIGMSDNVFVYNGKKIKQWTYMSIVGATVSVDTFFALSGILVAYLTLREMQKLGGIRRFNWPMYYFHRFWRLTPPYMLMIMVYVTLYRYISDGPMWQGNYDFDQYQTCRENWWTNLLYVNNLVRAEKMCVGWSWYLANDMQFYVLSPLILIPLFYNKVVGGLVSLVFLVVCTVTPALITKEHHYKVQQNSDIKPKDGHDFKNIYVAPYTRMGPYLAGLITGYLLYLTKCKFRMHKFLALVGWLITAFIVTSMIYGLYDDEGKNMWSLDESALYNGAGRTAWGAAVCWIVFACATGYGGVINELLSWKAFIPLGRLTYCAYLMHPLVMSAYYGSRRQLIYFNDYEFAYLFMAQMVASYGVAFVVSLAFESPMMGLEKAIFRRDKRS